MPKRFWIITGVAIVAATTAAVAFFNWRDEPEWTTGSPAALAEMKLGIENQMRFYFDEAQAHFDRAVELDPQFVAARVRRLEYLQRGDKEALEAELELLRKVDRTGLNDRERFLLDYSLGRAAREQAQADNLLTAYLETYPSDPFVLSIRCNLEFNARRYAPAKQCLQRLLEIDPNWAIAQNLLGYLAMSEGRFEDAEQMFRTYLFIAPNQANPHDSMAELLIVRGRYAEARTRLDEAVKLRPDFCAAWMRYLHVDVMSGQADALATDLERMETEGHCRRHDLERARCYAASWRLVLKGDFEGAWESQHGDSGCGEGGSDLLLAVRSGFLVGRKEEARASLEKLRERDQLYGDREPVLRAVAIHLGAIAAASELAESTGPSWAPIEAQLRSADETLTYQGAEEGVFKLFNRLDLAHVLGRLGQDPKAAQLRAEVARINPDLGTRFAGFPQVPEDLRQNPWPPKELR